MKKSYLDDPEADLDLQESDEEDVTPGFNRFAVNVQLLIAADSADEAWDIAKEYLATARAEVETENSDAIYDYDISDVEPAELDI